MTPAEIRATLRACRTVDHHRRQEEARQARYDRATATLARMVRESHAPVAVGPYRVTLDRDYVQLTRHDPVTGAQLALWAVAQERTA